MSPTLPDLDLLPAHRQLVLGILRTHVPQFTMWAFGSRVSGGARRFSDLDLALLGDTPLSSNTLARLREAFSESDLPFPVDLVDWARTDDAFRALIARRSGTLSRVACAMTAWSWPTTVDTIY